MSPTVEPLSRDALPEAADVLAEAFRDYPVMRHVLGAGDAYDERLRQLMDFFCAARASRDEPVLGVRADGALAAVALVSSERGVAGPELAGHRERLWASLGADARARYEAFGEATEAFHVEAPHLHLNMLGVRGAARGRGLGRTLLDAVHRASADDPWSTGVTPTTEDPENVPLYEHVGYRLLGSADVEGAFRTWGFHRPDDAAGA